VRPISITKQAPKPPPNPQLYQPLDITQFDENVCQDYYVVMATNKDKKDPIPKVRDFILYIAVDNIIVVPPNRYLPSPITAYLMISLIRVRTQGLPRVPLCRC